MPIQFHGSTSLDLLCRGDCASLGGVQGSSTIWTPERSPKSCVVVTGNSKLQVFREGKELGQLLEAFQAAGQEGT